MFIKLQTIHNEEIIINSDKVLFIFFNKKGNAIFNLEDGTSFEFESSYLYDFTFELEKHDFYISCKK